MTECRSCGAEIVWANIDGKRIPLDKRRVRAYRETPRGLEDHEEMKTVVKGKVSPMLLRISHFLTCPNASSHSKKKT